LGFEKFKGAQDKLGTQMRAVGEVMSIGKNYKEAFQKAIRSLENGRHGLGFAKDFHQRSLAELMTALNDPSSERQWMYEALRQGATVDQLHAKTFIKPWFIQQMKELVDLEQELLEYRARPLPELLVARQERRVRRQIPQPTPRRSPKPTSANNAPRLGWSKTGTPSPSAALTRPPTTTRPTTHPDRVPVSEHAQKVMVLGGGPNRIGQGIEFDYCCVHAALALREAGYETIMVNCNPETVSTDYDTSDKLYFEPLTLEDVLAIYEKERPEGVVVQFGGQTPLNLANELAAAGVRILGTSPIH
jgi:carbamoyl-phosphate synthase large subunit